MPGMRLYPEHAPFRARDPHYGNEGWWWERECAQCRSLFLDPMPAPSEIPGFYPEDDYYAYRPAGSRSRLKHVVMTALGCGTSTREPEFVRPGRVLDFGCGAGDFLALERDRGWECCGVEVNERAIAAAQARGLEVRRSTAEYPSQQLRLCQGQPLAGARARSRRATARDVPGTQAGRHAVHRCAHQRWPAGANLWPVLVVPRRSGSPSHVFHRRAHRSGSGNGFRPVRIATNSDYGSLAGSLQIFLNRHTRRISSDGVLFRFKPALLIGHWAARLLDIAGLGDKLELVALKPES